MRHRIATTGWLILVLGAVWFVFRDPSFDVRPLALGAVLPELDGLYGGARIMHSLVFSLVLNNFLASSVKDIEDRIVVALASYGESSDGPAAAPPARSRPSTRRSPRASARRARARCRPA